MGLINWFMGLFASDRTLKLDAYCGELAGEVFYKELAVQACTNLIANTVARSEFLTYEKGLEVRKTNYYLLNVEPNQNKSANKFWRDVICKLVRNNECLVIQQNGMFYLADSFDVVPFAFKENIYKNIVVNEYGLKNVYTESQVFHFELHNQKILDILEGVSNTHSKLVQASNLSYKRSKAKRGTLDVPTNYNQTEKGQKDLEDLLSGKFKRFFEAEGGAVLPLASGMKYTELASGTVSVAETSAIRNLINDIFDFTAIGFQIPPQLLKGDVADTDKSMNNFLTFCINPITEILTDEINRKYYGQTAYLDRTYTKLDASRIKVVDIKDIATALDVLFRVGANTINDNLRILGRDPISEPIGNERFITKNYQSTKELKGGEK